MAYRWILSSSWPTALNKLCSQVCAFRDFYKDVQRFGSRNVRLSAEECCRRPGAEASNRGKVNNSVHIVVSCNLCSLLTLCLCLFCLFQVPLISCASPWRAGETKNDACPKF
jgi:hypothetical protein